MTLRLDWCSHAAAKYAVEHWHYSKSMAAGKVVCIGVWEDDQYIGAIVFARGSNKWIGLDVGLTQLEAVELVRVALTKHVVPVSRMLAIAIRMLRKQSPGLRLVVSFADPNEGHIGGIYQANGWIYVGRGSQGSRCRPYRSPHGTIRHWRTVAGELAAKGLPSTVEAACRIGYLPLDAEPKHRYLYPLDAAMRVQIEPLRKPYPKRAASIQDASVLQTEEQGATPMAALHTHEVTA